MTTDCTLLTPEVFEARVMEAATLEGEEAVFMDWICHSALYDDPAVKALKALDAGNLHSNEWEHTEGTTLYHERVCVPNDAQLHHNLLHTHSTAVPGYPGCWKIVELVSCNYWWPGLSRYIAKFVAGCNASNQTKTFPMQKVGKLVPDRVLDKC